MASFCETCPFRGECIGDITSSLEIDILSTPIAQFYNERGGASKPIRVSEISTEEFEEATFHCNGPTEQVSDRRLRKPLVIQRCGATDKQIDAQLFEFDFQDKADAINGVHKAEAAIRAVETRHLNKYIFGLGALVVVEAGVVVGELLEKDFKAAAIAGFALAATGALDTGLVLAKLPRPRRKK